MKPIATRTVRRAPAADELGTTDDFWKNALEGAGDGVWDWDVVTGKTTFSKQWKAMLGYSEAEISNSYDEWEDRVHPDDLPGALSLITEHIEGRSPHYASEFRMRTKDGEWKWILSRGMVTQRDAEGRPIRLIGTHSDITARKAAKEREAANLELIVEDAPLGAVLEAVVHSVEAEHPAMRCAILLVDRERNTFHVGAAPGMAEGFRRVLEGMSLREESTAAASAARSARRSYVPDIEKQVLWPIYREAARAAGLVACWAEPIMGASGAIHGAFTCYYREAHAPNAAEIGAITSAARQAALAVERDQERTALLESEIRYRMVADHADDIVRLCDTEGKVLYLSPSFYRKTGWSPESAMHTEWRLFAHPEDAAELERVRLENLAGRRTTIEYRLMRKDGSWIWVESSSKPVLADGRVWRILTWSHDITERKKLEKEIVETGEREQQRIGGEIHDDLCQRLASIKLKFEMLTNSLEAGKGADPKQARQLWQQLAEATKVARNIAKGLSPVADEPEGLMNALGSVMPSLEAMHGVPIFFDCPEPVTIENRAVAAHLYRMAQELINNAAKHAGPEQIDVRLEMTQTHVKLEVENDGVSFQMPSALAAGRGMGLRILNFRANAIGAVLQYLKRPGGKPGTLARCLVPLAVCNPVATAEAAHQPA